MLIEVQITQNKAAVTPTMIYGQFEGSTQQSFQFLLLEVAVWGDFDSGELPSKSNEEGQQQSNTLKNYGARGLKLFFITTTTPS